MAEGCAGGSRRRLSTTRTTTRVISANSGRQQPITICGSNSFTVTHFPVVLRPESHSTSLSEFNTGSGEPVQRIELPGENDLRAIRHAGRKRA